MLTDTTSRTLLVVFLIAAILGWGAYFFSDGANESSQQVIELERQLSELSDEYADQQADYNSLIEERTALLTLYEDLQIRAEQDPPTDDGDQAGTPIGGISLYPYGREHYLETRLRYANKHLRRHRAQKERMVAALNEARQDNSHLAQQLESQPRELESQFVAERDFYEQAIAALSAQLQQTVIPNSTVSEPQQAADSEVQTTADELVAAKTVDPENEQTAESQAQVSVTVPELADGARVVELENQLNALNKTIHEAEERAVALADARTEIEQLETQLQTAKLTNQQVKAEKEHLNTQMVEQSAQFEEHRERYEQEIEALTTRLERAEVETTSTVALNQADSDSQDSTGQGTSSEPDDVAESGVLEKGDRERVLSLQRQLSRLQAMLIEVDSSGKVENQESATDQDSSERALLLQRQVSELQMMLEQSQSSAQNLQEAQTEIVELHQQLRQEIEENHKLQQELLELGNQVDGLALELASANQRTENMESMTQAVTEENQRYGELINQLQDSLGLTIAEKNTQILDLQTQYRIIEYPTDILFESGSAVLSSTGKQVLKEFSSVLEQDAFKGRTISFEGHTDNVPIIGALASQYPTNWELSLARAASAVRFVVDQGVAAERVRAVGYGSSRPLTSNDTDEGRSANRRIEVNLVPELEIVEN